MGHTSSHRFTTISYHDWRRGTVRILIKGERGGSQLQIYEEIPSVVLPALII